MSELLPYEDELKQQINDLPLPDENMAWADMKRRLKEKDDNDIIIWWRQGCMLWGLLLIVLIGSGWWLISKWKFNKGVEPTYHLTEKDNKKTDPNISKYDTLIKINEIKPLPKNRLKKADSFAIPEKILTIKKLKSDTNSISYIKKTENNNKLNTLQAKVKSNPKFEKVKSISIINSEEAISNTHKKINKKALGKAINNDKKPDTMQELKNDIFAQKKIDKSLIKIKTVIDSSKQGPMFLITMQGRADSNIYEKTADSTGNTKAKFKEKKEELKKNPDNTIKKDIIFSAGIALQQQIPIAGQKLVPYSSFGRKNLLTDYIPSPFFQIRKKDRWFAITGFRYAAPQYNKEFIYNQQKDTNTTGQNTITSLKLKKSFYHQLPISFNYYLKPNWSVGAGVSWNKFYGAIADRIVSNQADSVLSKYTFTFKKDTTSFFSKSYFQSLIETQYSLGRFYFGLRYTFGLQPYIQFQLPGGGLQREKNNSFQLFIRYELWKSKKE